MTAKEAAQSGNVWTRSFSIPLGVTFGFFVLKEPAFAPKVAGVAIISLGLVLVAMK